MPYASVDELPAAVKDKLKGKKRRQWLHVWNSEYNSHGDESRAFASAWSAVKKGFTPMSDFQFFLPISKIEKQSDGSCIVSGYASTQTRDLDGEIVSIDAIKKAWPSYWEYRNIREMHQSKAVGVGKESHIDEIGPFLRAKIVDPVAVQKCVEEVYKGFSIGGRKLAKSGDIITELELIEISLVDRPANPDCRIQIAKRAKDAKDGAYLLKIPRSRPAASRALSKMAKAVDILAKDDHKHEIECETGPPIEKDDGEPCKLHGVKDCPECFDKREVKEKERESLASEGNANPDGSFPIKNKSDLANARQAIGRSKNPGKTRKLIARRARELGVKLPDKWTKKLAKKLISKALTLNSSIPAPQPDFLVLKAPDAENLEDVAAAVHPLALGMSSPQLRKSGSTAEFETSTVPHFLTLKDSKMNPMAVSDNNGNTGLDAAIMDLVKRASEPSRAQRMEMCKAEMKKANDCRKSARESLREAHGVLERAYIAKMKRAEMVKAGKKPKEDDNDEDDMDWQKAMMGIKKAYGNLSTMKTFMKAAGENLAKAAGRSGQRGQEVSDSEPGAYEVPAGVKDLSPNDLATAGPAVGQHVSAGSPLIIGGKSANMVPQEVVDLAVENAMLKGQMEVLNRMPNGNRRPAVFDMNKMAGSSDREISAVLFEGIKPHELGNEDSNIHSQALGKMIGNMITSGKFGKSIMDPEFRGGAAGK